MGQLACKSAVLSFTDERELGGVPFDHFPIDASDTGDLWAGAWLAFVADLVAPPISVPVALALSRKAWAEAMEPLVSVPEGGVAALEAAANAAFAVLGPAVAPNLIVTAPTLALSSLLTPSPSNDPIVPAENFAAALATWISSATWIVPGSIQPPVAFAPAP